MAKAVAEAQGWSYGRHDEFGQVIHQATVRLGDQRVFNLWRKSANDLHGFFYERKMFLFPEAIKNDLDDVELMLDVLEPLTANLTAQLKVLGLWSERRKNGLPGRLFTAPGLTPTLGVNKMP